MNLFRFYLNKLTGKPSEFTFDLLGQSVALGITSAREIRRAREISKESDLVQHMQAILQPGDMIFDIGANIGLISILLARHADGSSSTVYAFEPEPRNFRQLQNNLRLNSLSERVYPQQMALGASEGQVELHIRGNEGEGRHSIASSKGATDSIAVTLDTLSSFCARHDAYPHIVKIDVEGAEGQVLAGLDDMPDDKLPGHIFLEVHPKGDGDRMPDGDSIQAYLQGRGYELAWSNVRGSGEHRHYRLPLSRGSARDA